ncbi:MAG: RNA polymerase factor sigma-32 [Desulfovibrio sp.]|jgi:RNA polymerase sigma-32 factor|nr:RNA polymerase factor sigma-32 [Desulfovibrio sp.]
MSAQQKQAGESGTRAGRGAGPETSEAAAAASVVAPGTEQPDSGAEQTDLEVELLAQEDDDCAPDADAACDDIADLAEEIAEDAYSGPDDEFAASPLPLPASGTDALAPFLHRPPEKPRDSFQTYLREINKFPLLKPEEESELARRVRDTGDADAAFRLIASHLRLVVRIAMDFQRRWMQNVLDLVQEGNVGLVRAVSKFDPDKGIKFSDYAAFWIKAYILKFIMDNWRMVKIGTTQTQRKLFYNLNKERRLLTAQGFDPDSAVLAERLNVSEDQVIEMEQRLDASDMSLDAPVTGEHAGGAARVDYLPALGPGIEATLADAEIADLVRERIASLKPRLNDKELYILEKRLLADEPVTLREIGDFYAVTRERVRQIEARLLQKIRDHLFNNIKDFSRDWIEH